MRRTCGPGSGHALAFARRDAPYGASRRLRRTFVCNGLESLLEADLQAIRTLAEQAVDGVFIGVRFVMPTVAKGVSTLAVGMARLLVHHPGWDVEHALAKNSAWERIVTTHGLQWRHRNTGMVYGGPAVRP